MSKETVVREETPAEKIEKWEPFTGNENYKKTLTKEEFLKQWIGFNFKVQLEEVVNYTGVEPDEVTQEDIMEFILYWIQDGLGAYPYRPWDENDQDDEIKEGDIVLLAW